MIYSHIWSGLRASKVSLLLLEVGELGTELVLGSGGLLGLLSLCLGNGLCILVELLRSGASTQVRTVVGFVDIVSVLVVVRETLANKIFAAV